MIIKIKTRINWSNKIKCEKKTSYNTAHYKYYLKIFFYYF